MRLTLLFCCNADGSEKKYIPLENQKILAAIKGKSYPFHIIFRVKLGWTNILKEFDRDMIKQNRKVVLFIDNAPCHKVTDLVLENVKIEFLPANTTSILQPLDQGIIHAFKVYFRQILVRKQLLAIEKGLSNKDFVKSISILDALTFAKRAWWLVKKETIENCFRKGGFFIENNSSDVVEEVIDVTIDPTEFEEYVNCDKELECFGTLTEDEIVSSLLDENSSEASSEENSEGECNDVPPTLVAAIGALSTVKHFMESKNLYLDEIESLEEKLFKCYFQTHHQKKITDFFIV
ncbi:tigger transposable element-derived protein 6-like [Bactrocera neohumeralis]|uniref:tigger transposable element-derived protein 6-like n=1 Tax=Bactrocera neohumeralis TaxID=98809 RepID=UPI002166A38C|nr:tigger transposable element-derived protein 6-like [Bactrocera neohumeralis]